MNRGNQINIGEDLTTHAENATLVEVEAEIRQFLY